MALKPWFCITQEYSIAIATYKPAQVDPGAAKTWTSA